MFRVNVFLLPVLLLVVLRPDGRVLDCFQILIMFSCFCCWFVLPVRRLILSSYSFFLSEDPTLKLPKGRRRGICRAHTTVRSLSKDSGVVKPWRFLIEAVLPLYLRAARTLPLTSGRRRWAAIVLSIYFLGTSGVGITSGRWALGKRTLILLKD